MSSLKLSSLNITVATTSDAMVSARSDIRLLKAALLYADTVTLCSPTVSWHLSRLQFTELTDERQQFEFALHASDLSEHEREEAIQIYELYWQLRAKHPRTPTESAQMATMHRAINEVLQFIASDITTDAYQAGMNELQPALDSGLVRIHPLNVEGVEKFEGEVIRVLADTVMSGKTYPLLDVGAGFIVQAAIHDGLISPTPINVKHSNSSMLAADILQRLPVFEAATFDEILKVRSELQEPLIRFRAAVLAYASEMQTAPWENDFRLDAEHLFIEKIHPAVLDIEEAVKDSKFAQALGQKAVTDQGIWRPAALGVAAFSLDYFAHFAHAALMAGAATLAEVRELVRIWREVRQEHVEKRREIERSQLYFVYQAGKLLQKAHKQRQSQSSTPLA